ncbi:hypothetical protein K437DRAFT_94577 [Tilletiaria anomala UBC 951]|uniref:Uncharacterized protein n=1 Tax=Tilletiaria anomala (strain ATCC 24038 / CBS 436.72 / UBC 951) TaxID=1037660 RepID=A0A066WQ99_TILAU|nr:uncharacterized protein K437DRAFT_94577 [Tilletiaria anomala UBC 951]KDN53184.1 hypothetical protein K437DRAFT_94577 [Tilletiaria anomala UBC 951]
MAAAFTTPPRCAALRPSYNSPRLINVERFDPNSAFNSPKGHIDRLAPTQAPTSPFNSAHDHVHSKCVISSTMYASSTTSDLPSMHHMLNTPRSTATSSSASPSPGVTFRSTPSEEGTDGGRNKDHGSPYSLQNISIGSNGFMGWTGFGQSIAAKHLRIANKSSCNSDGSPLSPKSKPKPTLQRKRSPQPLFLTAHLSSASPRVPGDRTVVAVNGPTTPLSAISAGLMLRPSTFDDSDDEDGERLLDFETSPTAATRLGSRLLASASRRFMRSTRDLQGGLSTSSSSGGADDEHRDASLPFEKDQSGRKRALSIEGTRRSFETARASAAKLFPFTRPTRARAAAGHAGPRRRSASADPTVSSTSLPLSSPVSLSPAQTSSEGHTFSCSAVASNHSRSCSSSAASLTKATSRSAFTGTGAGVVRRPDEAFFPNENVEENRSSSMDCDTDSEELLIKKNQALPRARLWTTVAMSPYSSGRALPNSPDLPPPPSKLSVLPSASESAVSALVSAPTYKPLRPRRPSEAVRLTQAPAAEERRMRRPGVAPRPTMRRLPPRKQRPSKALPPLPGIPTQQARSSPIEECDEASVQPDMEGCDEQLEARLAEDSLLTLQQDSDFAVGALMRTAAQLCPASSRQIKFLPVPQGVRRLDYEHDSGELIMIALVVGDRTFHAPSASLCGMEHRPFTGRFAQYIRNCLHEARWLTANFDPESTRAQRRPSNPFSAGAWVDSYLEMDIDDEEMPVEKAWPESEPGTPDRKQIARARVPAKRPSLASTWQALEGQRESTIAESVFCTPHRYQPNHPIIVELFLDRPSGIYELLLWTLREARLPSALRRGGIANNTDLQVQILAALREEAVFLGYSHLVAMVDAETADLSS